MPALKSVFDFKLSFKEPKLRKWHWSSFTFRIYTRVKTTRIRSSSFNVF